MSRDTPEALNHPFFDFDASPPELDDRTAMASRLAAVEQAYAELLARVDRYERERTEIRARLAHILARLG